MTSPDFDVVIAGGGFAGSALAGALSRGGKRVAVVERERAFRDRIRGEFTWPWGCLDAEALGLMPVLEAAGALELLRIEEYEGGAFSRTIDVVPRPGLTYHHDVLQVALLSWAEGEGATVFRPARVVAFEAGPFPRLRIDADGNEMQISAKLIVGATGRESGARAWTGGQSITDPEHHRFGGVAIEGAEFPSGSLLLGLRSPEQVILFDFGRGVSRLYLRTFSDEIKANGLDRSFDAFLAYARPFLPGEILKNARQAGPLGFFPNGNSWATRLAAPGLALIGDVAGSADPSGGHGTSLVFRDVRVLCDLLLSTEDWEFALAEYERQRWAYYDVIRARDRWYSEVSAGRGAEGGERRARQAQAREADPTLGGFGAIEFLGPDGLVPDEAHRRVFFGEHLSLEEISGAS